MQYTKMIKKLDDKEKSDPKFVLKLVKFCNFEPCHTKHVTNLPLKIFDDLQDLNKLSQQEKFLLLCAGILHDSGILHDIGVYTRSPKDHHKAALNIILDNPIRNLKIKPG